MKGRQLSYEEVEDLPIGSKVWVENIYCSGEVRRKKWIIPNIVLINIKTFRHTHMNKETFERIEMKVYEWLEDTQEATREELDTSKSLYVLEQKEKLNAAYYLNKLKEEVNELIEAFINGDRENIFEEELDVHQTLVSLNAEIIKPSKEEMAEAIDKHNKKLEGRGYKFKGQALRVVD